MSQFTQYFYRTDRFFIELINFSSNWSTFHRTDRLFINLTDCLIELIKLMDYQIKENLFFLGRWLTVIFFSIPDDTPFRGRNIFTWSPTLIFLVRAPWGKMAWTWGTTVLFTTPPRDRKNGRRLVSWKNSWCQSYKAPTIVIYDSRVVPDLKLSHITTLES